MPASAGLFFARPVGQSQTERARTGGERGVCPKVGTSATTVTRYRPWLQSVNGIITLANSTEWVTPKRQEPFFYVPYSPWPYCSYEEMKKMRAILLRWERSDTW